MLGQKTPRFRVYVDEDACGNAALCRKCVKACLDHGPNCLSFGNKQTPPVGELAPKTLNEIDHKVLANFMVMCDGCGQCVQVCPNGAMTLVRPEMREPAERVSFGDIIYCHTLKGGEKVYPTGFSGDLDH